MESLHIEFQPKIKEKLLEFLNSFSKKELIIVEDEANLFEETNAFKEHKNRLETELKRVESGESKLRNLDELDEYLEKIISKYEN